MVEMPYIKTPDTTTNQNMWAFVFTEIQRIHTEELNPIRLRVNSFDSKYLIPYRGVLKTLADMFAAFLYNDFPDEKKKIEELFEDFQTNYNKAEYLKKTITSFQMISNEVNELYYKCLNSLELVDNMLEIIRQKKGFGLTEQTTFVINERASKALRINSNINNEILKLFKVNKEKRKDYIDKVSEKADELLKKDSLEDETDTEKEEDLEKDGSVSDTGDTRTS